MPEDKYKTMIHKCVMACAFSELLGKQQAGSKGKGIEYKYFQIADYLQPNQILTVGQQRKIFEIRSS